MVTYLTNDRKQRRSIQVQKISSGRRPTFYSIFDWLRATLNYNSLFSTRMLGPMLAMVHLYRIGMGQTDDIGGNFCDHAEMLRTYQSTCI